VALEDEPEPRHARRPAFNWRYGAIPLCLFALWLVSPEDKGLALEKKLAAAQSELERAAHDASAKARSTSDTAAEQTRMLEQVRRRAEILTHDLTDAQNVIRALKAKAVLADDARLADEASLAKASKALEEAGRKVELSELELTKLRQAIIASNTSADAAALEQAKALRGQAVAEVALKAANDSLELERARTASTARDLDRANWERDSAKQLSAELKAALELQRQKLAGMAGALTTAQKEGDAAKGLSTELKAALVLQRQKLSGMAGALSAAHKERDAAKQLSADLTAALELQRQNLARMAGELSAAHKAIDDIKTQSNSRAIVMVQSPKVQAAASARTNLPGRPARQPRVGGKQNPEPRKSRRPLETTITLPDALLPIMPSTR